MAACAHGPREKRLNGLRPHLEPQWSKTTLLWIHSREVLSVFPIMDSIPSRSVPVVTRALILINVVVFFLRTDTAAGDAGAGLLPVRSRTCAICTPSLGDAGGVSRKCLLAL